MDISTKPIWTHGSKALVSSISIYQGHVVQELERHRQKVVGKPYEENLTYGLMWRGLETLFANGHNRRASPRPYHQTVTRLVNVTAGELGRSVSKG